jgi:hypothetical protein
LSERVLKKWRELWPYRTGDGAYKEVVREEMRRKGEG